jgi:hypothetical protein
MFFDEYSILSLDANEVENISLNNTKSIIVRMIAQYV